VRKKPREKGLTKGRNTTLEIFEIVTQIFAAGRVQSGHNKWAL
jgi:hypothetical protein